MKTSILLFSLVAGPLAAATGTDADLPIPASAVVAAPAELAAVRQELFAPVFEGKVVSLAVIVLRDGEIIWEEAAGWADREQHIPATTSTIYPVASVTKALTATAVMKLVEEGRLSFYDRAEEMKLFTSQLSDSTVTIHDLLSMRGGVPHMWLYRYQDAESMIPEPWGDVSTYASAAMPVGQHHYSNLSADLAGQAAGRVLGKPYSEAMDELLFQPLGMKDSGVGIEYSLRATVAAGYDRRGDRLDKTHLEPDGGAGGYCSVRDLGVFAQAHLGKGDYLSAESLAALHTPPENNEGYLGGWAHVDHDGQPLCLISNGVGLGGVSSIWIIPESGLAVVAASNCNAADTDGPAIKILDVLRPGFAETIGTMFADAEKKHAPVMLSDDVRIEGTWEGHLQTGDTQTTITLQVDQAGMAILQIDRGLKLLVNNARWEEGTLLRGTVPGPLPVQELRKFPQKIDVQLYHRGDELRGIFRATSDGARSHFGLPFPVKLSRKEIP